MKATGLCSKCGLVREVGKKCKPCERKRCSERNKRLRAANPERAKDRDRHYHLKYIDKRHAANKQWYIDHPEKQKEYDSRKDPANERARSAIYRDANRSLINARKSARYAADRERHRALSRKYGKRRRDRYRDRLNAEVRKWQKTPRGREYVKVYRRLHPEIARAANARRRARKIGAIGTHTAAEWQTLKKKWGYRCADCHLREGQRFPETAGSAWADKTLVLSRGHRVPLEPCSANEWRGGSDAIFNILPQCMPCNLKQGSKLHSSVTEFSLFDRYLPLHDAAGEYVMESVA